MTAIVVEHRADQLDGRVRVLEDQLRKQAAAVAGQFLPQPGVGDLPEGEVGPVAVHDVSSGIDIGLDRIGRDQALAETVDRRADHLVERFACGREVKALPFGKAVRQDRSKRGGNRAAEQRADELAHPDEQFARGKLRECHGGNGGRGDAFGQQHGDPAGQHGRLARPGRRLDEKRAIVDANREPPGLIVGECLCGHVHHSASQARVASPSSSRAAASFRSRYVAPALAGSAKARSS